MRRSAFVAAGAAASAAGMFPSIAMSAAPTVRIGYVDSFSGPLADLGALHEPGVLLAIDEANRRGRIRYELVKGDDASKPAIAGTELRRLSEQERVDVVLQGASSASALAMMPIAENAGLFMLCIGPNDTSICGTRASRSTFRFAPNVQMMTRALAQPILARGKKWYFLASDFAFGNDSYNRLAALLRNAGGTEVGADKIPLGTSEFSSQLTKVRNSGAEELVLCLAGFDTAACARQFVSFGLHKTMRLNGIFLEDSYAKAIPLEELRGSVFGLVWSPAVSPEAKKLGAKLSAFAKKNVSFRHYMAYVSTTQLIDRIEKAESTRAETLIPAFSDHSFDATKATPATWRACDHQCVQDTYAGAIVGPDRYQKTGYLFDVVSDVRGERVAGSCADTDAAAAAKIVAGGRVPDRPGAVSKLF